MDPASDKNFLSIQRKKYLGGNLQRKTDNEVNHIKIFYLLMQAFLSKYMYRVIILLPNFCNKLFKKLILKYSLKNMYN